MRNFEERKAEVFRRSEKRVRDRRKRSNRILTVCSISLYLVLVVGVATLLPNRHDSAVNRGGQLAAGQQMNADDGVIITIPNYKGDSTGNVPGGNPSATVDTFSFSLVWGCYGISSYDSETGTLVKTTDATNPADYITAYTLTDQQKQKILGLIVSLNVTSYPDDYDPHQGQLHSSPSMTLILSVKLGSIEKTITAADIAMHYESPDPRGQAFLSVCKEIEDILIATDVWNALPEYEHFYD